MKEIVSRVKELVEPILKALGLELVEVYFRREPQGWVLRLLIDKDGGVNLEDCVQVSEVVGDLLDAEDFIHHAYNLEVSSPGVERPLVRERDYERFAGRKAKLTTKRPLKGRRNFTGIILGIKDGLISLELADGQRVEIPFSAVEKAHLKFEFK
ncbi:ribosome maturation factor RimP [Thermosulfuriphilus sp.]